ncbi:MAG: cell division protein ZapA [Bacteroidota bacterium]
MHKSIRVNLLGREYPLRVRVEDEAMTLDVARFVDERASSLRQRLPGESPATILALTALGLAEELLAEQQQSEEGARRRAHAIGQLAGKLKAAIGT